MEETPNPLLIIRSTPKEQHKTAVLNAASPAKNFLPFLSVFFFAIMPPQIFLP